MNGGQNWLGAMATNGGSAIKIRIPWSGKWMVAGIGWAQLQWMAAVQYKLGFPNAGQKFVAGIGRAQWQQIATAW